MSLQLEAGPNGGSGGATRSSLSGETQGSCHAGPSLVSDGLSGQSSLSLVVERSSCVQTPLARQHSDTTVPNLRYLQSTARASALQLLARSVRCVVLGCRTISRYL